MDDTQRKNPLTPVLKRTIGAKVALLRGRREQRGEKFSQNDLAMALREMGQPAQQGQIGHIEAGRRLPSVELLYALAEFFATSLDFLTGRTEEASSIAAIEEDLQTGGISGRLGEAYKRLPVDRQLEVYQFVEALSTIQQKNRPTTENERRRANILAILDSVERNISFQMRVQIERMISDQGYFSSDGDA